MAQNKVNAGIEGLFNNGDRIMSLMEDGVNWDDREVICFEWVRMSTVTIHFVTEMEEEYEQG